MLRLLVALALVMAVVPATAAAAVTEAGPTPIMKVVQPDSAKAGDEVTVSGTNLAKDTVAAVYLTQGEKTIKVKVTSQTETDVKFLIPADLKAGRFGIMVLTTGGDNARQIDEPVYISVE
ncbi:MAG TPA: IPT/TIG domain-containing protein [Bryobacteraceae bacterium]|nr:IPT/TIG domain-containing protein [Bryobacteraceae bacterium]